MRKETVRSSNQKLLQESRVVVTSKKSETVINGHEKQKIPRETMRAALRVLNYSSAQANCYFVFKKITKIQEFKNNKSYSFRAH